MENKDTFKFSYSAKEQEEIAGIRKKYMPREEDKMETLRRLDRSVVNKANMISVIIGVIGALIMGGGMSMAMVYTDTMIIPGIIVGVVGIAVVALAYPVYKYVLEKERKRVAPEIIRLTDELIK